MEPDDFQRDRSVPEIYSPFTYKALHNLSPKKSKMMKKCLFAYESSARAVRGRWKAVLRGATFCYRRFKRKPGPRLKDDFAKGDVSSDLIGLYTNDEILGMLRGKDFEALDKVILFVGAFLDRIMVKYGGYPVPWVYIMFS